MLTQHRSQIFCCGLPQCQHWHLTRRCMHRKSVSTCKHTTRTMDGWRASGYNTTNELYKIMSMTQLWCEEDPMMRRTGLLASHAASDYDHNNGETYKWMKINQNPSWFERTCFDEEQRIRTCCCNTNKIDCNRRSTTVTMMANGLRNRNSSTAWWKGWC